MVLALNPLLAKMEFQSLLRMLRDHYTLRELSSILGIDIPTISKYANYQLVPSLKRINQLMPKLIKLIDPLEELKKAITSRGKGVPDINWVIGRKPYLLHYAVIQMVKKLIKREFTKILTIEGGGLVIASTLSIITGKGLVFGVRNAYFENGITEPYHTTTTKITPRIRIFISIPGGLITSEDKVLIVDDIAWTGGTIRTLYSIAQKTGARVEGVELLASYRETLEKLRRELGEVKINSLITLD